MANETTTPNPAQGATFTGQGYATVCTLPKGTVTNPGAANLRPLVALYWLANQPQGQVGPTGYTKGTPAFYAYLAWYTAMCTGYVQTKQYKYTNEGGATYPLGNANGTQPGRLSQHARWVLGQVCKTAPAVTAAASAQHTPVGNA